MHHRVNANRPVGARRSRRSAFISLVASIALTAGVVVAAASPASAGPAWTVASSPNPAGSVTAVLNGVSCPSVNSCFGVGSSTVLGTTKALGEHWNGHNWAIVATPNPSTATSTRLNAISCPSTTSCFAVGSYAEGTLQKNLAERWNGSSWSILPIQNPTGHTGSGLSGVSCPSARSCFAVGAYSFGLSTVRTLAAHWNGALWNLVGSPNISVSNATFLNAVSCPSLKSCFAVGNSTINSSARSLVEHWNGSLWGAMQNPAPSGATGSALNGVSCPSPKSCFAVGSSIVAAQNHNLAQHWNGSGWSFNGAPTGSGASSSTLSGVSCPTTQSCFAVGSFTKAGAAKSLVDHWNGSAWGSMASPNPGTLFNHLYSVSCAAKTSCFAVGNTEKLPPATTLTERYA